MSKDKPLMQTSMQDFAATNFGGTKKNGIIMPGAKPVKSKNVVEQAFDTNYDALDADIQEYNNRVPDLDPEYASITPHTKVIIRAFHKEVVKDKSGLITSAPTTFIPERGVQGAPIRSVNSPWAFSRKAVIVATPEGFDTFKPGDIVQISLGAITVVKETATDYSVPFHFTLWDWQEVNPPTNRADKNYGYFIIDPYQHIQARISSSNPS